MRVPYYNLALSLNKNKKLLKNRWGVEVGNLEDKAKFIAGNSIVAAGMVAYAGPFTLAYRQELEGSWIKMLKTLNFKHSDDVTMRNFLGVPVQIQTWNIAGLPKDDTSTENGRNIYY